MKGSIELNHKAPFEPDLSQAQLPTRDPLSRSLQELADFSFTKGGAFERVASGLNHLASMVKDAAERSAAYLEDVLLKPGMIRNFSLGALTFGTITAQAAQVTLAWDKAPGSDTSNWITRVWRGTEPGIFTGYFELSATNQTITLVNLKAGRSYAFVLTNFDPASKMESDQSNTVTYTVPGNAFPTPVPRELPDGVVNVELPQGVPTTPIVTPSETPMSVSILSRNGLPEITVSGEKHQWFAVESSDSLAPDASWSRIFVGQLSGTNHTVVDYSVDGSPQAKFYRAVSGFSLSGQ